MIIIKKILKHKVAITLFLAIELLLYLLMSMDQKRRISEYLADSAKSYDTEYKILLHSFSDKAKIAFDTLVNKDEVKKLFAQGIEAQGKQRDILRKKLYTLLLPEYNKLKEFGFKQVHFQLPDNHSFLRMHAPKCYGDDLSDFRETVKYVNKTHKSIGGFEEGVANNGYRFVFPLFNHSRYLGSVELSFSAYTLLSYLKSETMDAQLIISKKALLSKSNNILMDDYYRKSSIDAGFVVEKAFDKCSVKFQKEERFHALYMQKNQKSFSLDKQIENKTYIEIFIPIKSVLSHKINAYIVILSSGKYFTQIIQNFWTVFIMISFSILLLFIHFYRSEKLKRKMQAQNKDLALSNNKLKTIIDGQKDMIIITDGEKIIESNAKVLDFFGLDSSNQLVEKYHCICKFFLSNEDYFHLGKVPNGEDWMHYIQTLPEKKRIVNMVGTDMQAKAFYVKMDKYGEANEFIISFSDITDMIIEQKILVYQAYHDKLTNIYNRHKLDEVFISLCKYNTFRKEQVGLIMFDIDHFKKVNDVYGHDIGDEILKVVTKIVQNVIRDEDIFGRWGGEEFILIMRHATIEETYEKAQRLKVMLEEYDYQNLPKITASFGVTSLKNKDTPNSFIKRVDDALYMAKDKGRNCVVKHELYNYMRTDVKDLKLL